jgi:glycosyltransferase involved in cell wall biosynthesis
MTKVTKRRIFIEAATLVREQRTGVDYLAEELFGELIRRSPEVEFICFSFAQSGAHFRLKAPNVRHVTIHKMSERWYRLLLLMGIAPSVEWLLDEPVIEDCIFPNFSSWPLKTRDARSYPYVHDTSYLDTPEYASPRLRRFLDVTVRRSVQRAAGVLVNSESTKRDVMRHYKVPARRITVLYPAVPQSAKPATMDLPKEYVLFIGTIEPRKNVANLIHAHTQLPDTLRRRYPLILAGKKGWLDDDIQQLIASHHDQDVRWLGYVSDAQRARLWSGAALFVYPSMYEGFGMPVIEALSHGVPTITTRLSSLPEAGGTAAYYAKPDAKSLAQAIELVLTDVARRKTMSVAGRRHAATFTWTKSAQRLQKLLGIK